MSDLGIETLFVVRGGGRDAFGNKTTPAPDRKVDGCQVYPRSSVEADGRASTVLTGYTALAPLGADILSTDQIRWRGNLYDVEGDPGEWRFLDGGDAALQVALTRAKG